MLAKIVSIQNFNLVILCTSNSSKERVNYRGGGVHIIEKTSPVSFHLKNQLDGSATKAHAENIRLANIDNWEIPKDRKGRLTRRARFVAPLSSSSDESDNELSDDERPL